MYTLAGVRVERVAVAEGTVTIEASPVAAARPSCPTCGRAPGRVHSRYVRTLRDLPACGRPVRVRLVLTRLGLFRSFRDARCGGLL